MNHGRAARRSPPNPRKEENELNEDKETIGVFMDPFLNIYHTQSFAPTCRRDCGKHYGIGPKPHMYHGTLVTEAQIARIFFEDSSIAYGAFGVSCSPAWPPNRRQGTLIASCNMLSCLLWRALTLQLGKLLRVIAPRAMCVICIPLLRV